LCAGISLSRLDAFFLFFPPVVRIETPFFSFSAVLLPGQRPLQLPHILVARPILLVSVFIQQCLRTLSMGLDARVSCTPLEFLTEFLTSEAHFFRPQFLRSTSPKVAPAVTVLTPPVATARLVPPSSPLKQSYIGLSPPIALHSKSATFLSLGPSENTSSSTFFSHPYMHECAPGLGPAAVTFFAPVIVIPPDFAGIPVIFERLSLAVDWPSLRGVFFKREMSFPRDKAFVRYRFQFPLRTLP